MAKRSSKLRLDVVSCLAELERIGWKFEAISDDEVRCVCPAHDDSNPSVNLNTKKGLWQCHAASCKARGDIVAFIAFALNRADPDAAIGRNEVIFDLSKRYDLEVKKTLPSDLIEKFHKEIDNAGPLKQELYKRGVDDQMIRKARLGYCQGRITIPIYNQHGECINIRRYLPGAPGPEKMKNTPGYGANALFQIEQTKYDAVWIMAGEMKALVAAKYLNPHGIGAVAPTTGEGNWDPTFTDWFRDKRVYICYDVDQAGENSARAVAGFLYYSASSVHVVHLPLDKTKHPKGDFNDYAAIYKPKDEEILNLMQTAEKFLPPTIEEEEDADAEVRQVRLTEAILARNMGHRIEVNAVVAALDTTPFLIPKDIGVACDKNQANCVYCPVRAKEADNKTGYVELTIRSTSPGILDMINSGKNKQQEAIHDALRIPPCKIVKFHVRGHYNVSDIRLTPQLQVSNDAGENVVLPAYGIADSIEMNVPYVASGRVYPHPRSQQAVLLMDSMELGDDSLSSFDPSEEDLKELEIFKAEEDTVESVERALDRIYTDLETNVTRIYQRRDLHLALDLTYHSCLNFDVDGRSTKGWVNSLIIGDSSQGKSESTLRLIEHYKLGERADCKNASRAGLIGGLTDMGSRRMFVAWGVIPTHDRGLVVLEEVKGTDPEVIASLTDMRSSGIAQIEKIEKRRAYARTRLIMVSNPRSGRPISAYNFGVEAIKELIPGLEDIRRLDLALVLSNSQIDIEEINKLSRSRNKVPSVFTSELCHRLVLWAWTRKADQIKIEGDALDLCFEEATKFCNTYSEMMPLVDRGTMREKITRLAIAAAARVFSSDDLQNLVVKKCHVQLVCKFLRRCYDDTSMGYLEFSKAQTAAVSMRDGAYVEKRLTSTKHPRDMVENFLVADEITINDIQDWCDQDREDAQRLLSVLVRKHALTRKKRCYIKTSDFIVLLKKMQEKGLPESAQVDGKEEF